MPHHTASCLCGAIRIIATGAPDRVGLCHCMDCRKHHGPVLRGRDLPLGGGDKSSQRADIARARQIAAAWESDDGN